MSNIRFLSKQSVRVQSLTDIFEMKLQQRIRKKLPGRATRMNLVNGNIWIPIPTSKLIQVLDKGCNVLQVIKLNNCPRSVYQASTGDIILASDTGLQLINKDGKTISCLKKGTFYDVSGNNDTMVSINSENISIWKRDSFSCEWNEISCFKGKGMETSQDSTLLYTNKIIYYIQKNEEDIIYQNSEDGKFIKQYKPPNTKRLFLTTSDVCGNFIVSSYRNHLLCLFANDKFQNLTIDESISPFNCLFDQDGQIMWILGNSPAYTTVIFKYSK